MHFENLVKINRNEVVREMPEISKPTNTLSKTFSTGKIDQDHVQIKGVLKNKTIGYCTYRSMWTNKDKGIKW
jgi:hypothetical protein